MNLIQTKSFLFKQKKSYFTSNLIILALYYIRFDYYY